MPCCKRTREYVATLPDGRTSFRYVSDSRKGSAVNRFDLQRAAQRRGLWPRHAVSEFEVRLAVAGLDYMR